MLTEFFEYVANLILAMLFHNGAISVPAYMDVAIFEVMPARDGTGGTETAYTGYARRTIACGAASRWAAPSTSGGRRMVSNLDLVSFPQNTGAGVNAAGYVVFDDSGNPIFWDTKAFAIPNLFVPTIAVGALVFGFTAACPLSFAWQDKILEAFFRNAALAALTSITVDEQTTMPDKSDVGGVSASYTGYASASLACGAASDWDAAETDGSGYRKCKNTALFACGTKNTGAPQTLGGVVTRDNAGTLLTLVAYSPTIPIGVGTTFKHKAGELSIGF